MTLLDTIDNVRTLLAEKRLVNEASVSSGIVNPLLHALGWPVFDPTIFVPEYKVEGRRVDFALVNNAQPVMFVEVKQPGQIDGADRQLFEYAFHVGVQMAVLTDGGTWHFYLPAEQGTYDERRVYLLDLAERDPAESADRLTRYLDYRAVITGAAYENARTDYRANRQRKETAAEIPKVWDQLISQEDSTLVELISAEVESRSGYKPSTADITSFLSRLRLADQAQPPRPTLPIRVPPRRRSPGEPPIGRKSEMGFWFQGEFHPRRNGRDVMLGVFQELDRHDDAFLDRFIALPKHGSKRRYLAKTREELYPGRPDILDGNVSEVRKGYFLGTNHSRKTMREIIRMACKTAYIRFDKDLQIRLE